MKTIRKLSLRAGLGLLTAVAAFGQFSSPVREVDVPARSAVTAVYTCTVIGLCSSSYAIPAGYRFVVEMVAGRLVFPGATYAALPPAHISISKVIDGNQVQQGDSYTVIGFDHLTTHPSSQTLGAARVVRLYFDELPVVTYTLPTRPNDPYAQLTGIYLTGHLVKK